MDGSDFITVAGATFTALAPGSHKFVVRDNNLCVSTEITQVINSISGKPYSFSCQFYLLIIFLIFSGYGLCVLSAEPDLRRFCDRLCRSGSFRW